MGKKNSIKEVYREESGFKYFLLCILITGLAYGLYKGMLDNYLAEVVKMGEMDRGVTEFFRELPGIALVFILAAFYMLSAETLFKAGAVIMLCGMGMHALLPASKVLATLEGISGNVESLLSPEQKQLADGGHASPSHDE